MERSVRLQARPAIDIPATSPAADIKNASVMAARLIEAAISMCREDDLAALDCLMDARRALSPIVDKPRDWAANTNIRVAEKKKAAL